MEDLKALAIVIAVGAILMALARWSRKKWENEEGRVSLKEKMRAITIFLTWSALFSLVMVFQPEVFVALFIFFTFGVLPIGRAKKGIVKDLFDMGFLSIVLLAPIALIYHYSY